MAGEVPSTPQHPPVATFAYGWVPGIVQCLCLCEGFDLRSFLSAVTPHTSPHRHAPLLATVACCFSSAIRRKKKKDTPSETMRYTQHPPVALKEYQPPLVECHPQKEKERYAKRETRAVGRSASTHTASPSLLRYGWASVAFAAFSLQAKALTSVRKLSAVTPLPFATTPHAPCAQPSLA